jgi:hypothetical protein
LPPWQPDRLLHFIELDEFREDWDELGLDVENDLWDLQNEIMRAPDGPPVIQGTGGLRKMRFAPTRWRLGKSGAVRVCYVYFKAYGITLLVMAYGKNRKDNLRAAEKRDIARYIGVIRKWLASRSE